MFKFHSMKQEVNVLLTFIVNSVFFEKYLESILIDFLPETAAHLTMQLHHNSKNSIALFWVYQSHLIKFSYSIILD